MILCMRLLTVKAPWGHLIASGRKTIEARSWSTTYRGPVAILQGVGVNPIALRAHGLSLDRVTRGAVVAVRDLVDVRPILPSDSAAAGFAVAEDDEGFAWVLAGGYVVQPVPMKGTLGLTRAPHGLVELLERQAA